MIGAVVIFPRPVMVDGEKIGPYPPVDSVVRQLERLDELDRQARSDEVSDGAIDRGAIRTNVHRLLHERERNPSLEVEAGQHVIREATDCHPGDQRAEIATGRRLRQPRIGDLGR